MKGLHFWPRIKWMDGMFRRSGGVCPAKYQSSRWEGDHYRPTIMMLKPPKGNNSKIEMGVHLVHEYGHFLIDWATMPCSIEAHNEIQKSYDKLWRWGRYGIWVKLGLQPDLRSKKP